MATGALAQLSQSPLFQLSNGAKELFHSNFLYWLSLADWKAFLSVMRKLAGVSSFSWESHYSPGQNNLEVRRESNHFDLSIFIKQGKSWLPVLVLENKVKSLPDFQQLVVYQNQAYKMCKSAHCNITFILLSLIPPFVNRPQGFAWSCKSYQDLSGALQQVKLSNHYYQTILTDYVSFVDALHQWTTSCLTISGQGNYNTYILGGNAVVEKMRLADLQQKIYYAQLLNMLIQKLNQAGIHNEIAEISKVSNPGVYLNTGYSHGYGSLDAMVRHQNYSIGVQLQGDKYEHSFYSRQGFQTLSQMQTNLDFFFEFGTTKQSSSTKYPWSLFPANKKLCKQGYFGVYKPHRAYQYVKVPNTVTFSDVIDCIVNDIICIQKNIP